MRLLICFLMVLGFAASAQAGFQWTAPTASAPAAMAMKPQPVAPVQSENLLNETPDVLRTMPDGPASAAPIYGNGMTDDPITWNTPRAATRRIVENEMPRAPQNVLPAMQQPQQPTSLYTLGTMGSKPSRTMEPSDKKVADGFGRDLPLVMAIRQIVPSDYGFVFDDGIDLNSRVSWQGGRAWDVVLQETLNPLGLQTQIRDNVVTIIRRTTNTQTTQIGPVGGPVVLTETNMQAGAMPMVAMPVSMASGPAAIADPVPVTPVNVATRLAASKSWSAGKNTTLRRVLEDWTARVGVNLYWASEYDYPLQNGVNIDGTFEEAVQTLLKGLSESRPRPMGRLHPNLPDGPAVLIIETRQNSM